MSPATVETELERWHRVMQRIEDGGALACDAHCDVLFGLSEALDKEAEKHRTAHFEAKTEAMIEWHRGMWEAFEYASRLVSRATAAPEENL